MIFIVYALISFITSYLIRGNFQPEFWLDAIIIFAGALILDRLIYWSSRKKETLLALLLGVIFGWILFEIYSSGFPQYRQYFLVTFLVLLPLSFLSLSIKKSELFSPLYWVESLRKRPIIGSKKILDSSVIIDGRIADICSTGFIEGPILIPKFVLAELQKVADSSDSLKRQRGRRGLDIVERLKTEPEAHIVITETDFPEIKGVDQKLIELARRLNAKIITNDFNLNKMAKIQGVKVLNINELANALKPVVLPGETMRVFILKEGKERDQGVAYLDDGTMVVVDNARKMIGKTIEITVTSVLQTTAGKMIFGRYTESSGPNI